MNIRSRVIGHIKLVKVTENFSTAYVTEAFQELRLGDFVGGTPVEGTAISHSTGGSSDSAEAPPAGDDLSLDDESLEL